MFRFRVGSANASPPIASRRKAFALPSPRFNGVSENEIEWGCAVLSRGDRTRGGGGRPVRNQNISMNGRPPTKVGMNRPYGMLFPSARDARDALLAICFANGEVQIRFANIASVPRPLRVGWHAALCGDVPLLRAVEEALLAICLRK